MDILIFVAGIMIGAILWEGSGLIVDKIISPLKPPEERDRYKPPVDEMLVSSTRMFTGQRSKKTW